MVPACAGAASVSVAITAAPAAKSDGRMTLCPLIAVCRMSASLCRGHRSDLVAVAVYQRRKSPEAARLSAIVTQFTTGNRFAAFRTDQLLSWPTPALWHCVHWEPRSE